MLNLQKRINGVDENKAYLGSRINIRDKLLAQEVQELQKEFRNHATCKITFPNPTQLHEMELAVTPVEGMYTGGLFKFSIRVPPEYNNVPPTVECKTRVWHPNINEEGKICLSILRVNSLDDFGWMPTRRMRDVVMGLASLFGDLISFDDPLNQDAANQYKQSPEKFQRKVTDYIYEYCENNKQRRGYRY
uniref:E2 NEDD8-conjugating enzyme n=1 Tax=Steinernema glaseri TaxID=37863 RepID=A0A1I7YN64_9BILA